MSRKGIDAIKWEVACLLMDLARAAEDDGATVKGQVMFNPDVVDAISLRDAAQEIHKGAM